MTRELLLILAGAMIGTGALSIFKHLSALFIMRGAQLDFLNDVLEEVDQLYSEIDQHGFETYNRMGKVEMRKKKKAPSKTRIYSKKK
tara:strand:+ start:72 stop:332 length:261 start_codon:yes stop_codon:yes gene_type:complete